MKTAKELLAEKGLSNLRVVSDGTGAGTHVYVDDEEIEGIVRLIIHPIRAGQEYGRITLECYCENIQLAHEYFEIKQLTPKREFKHYGKDSQNS